MREFKFRIWDKARRRMSQWEEMKENWNLHVFVTSDEDLEIMQYTGLKDRNGQEIYEGDIVARGKYNHEIVWNEKKGWFGIDDYDYGLTVLSQHLDYICVIGNIYENPELLEAQNV